MKNVKKLVSLSLIFVLLFSTVSILSKDKTVEAKATLAEKQTEVVYTKAWGGYGSIGIKGADVNAKYTFSANKSGYLQATGGNFYMDGKVRKTYLTFQIKKKITKSESIKVTVKETIGKKTRKLGVVTVKIKVNNTLNASWCENLSTGTLLLEKGYQYHLSNLVAGYYENVIKNPQTSDSSVASISKNIVTAKKEGEAKLTFQSGGKNMTVMVKVVAADQSSAAKARRKLADSLSKLGAKKLTSSNVISYYNSYVTIRSNKYYPLSLYTTLDSDGRVLYPFTCNMETPSYALQEFLIAKSSSKGNTPEVLSISSASTKGLKVKLANKMTTTDIIWRLYLMGSKTKYTSSTKTRIQIRLVQDSSNGDYIYAYGNVKKGQQTLTMKPLTGKYMAKWKKKRNYVLTVTKYKKNAVQNINVKLK